MKTLLQILICWFRHAQNVDSCMSTASDHISAGRCRRVLRPPTHTPSCFCAGRVSDFQTTPIQPTTFTWCTEPLGDNRYFAGTDEGVVTRSGESGEPLTQEGSGAEVGLGESSPNDCMITTIFKVVNDCNSARLNDLMDPNGSIRNLPTLN